MLPDSTRRYDVRLRQLQAVTVLAVRRAWGRMTPAASWEPQFNANVGPKVTALLTASQVATARESDAYLAAVLAELKLVPNAAPGVISPTGLAGLAGDGMPIESLVGGAVVKSGQAFNGGATASTSLDSGEKWLETIAQTIIADTARAATAAAMSTYPEVDGYVRMIEGGACSRCVVLAGKFYRWNTGFDRHPACKCVHIPAREEGARFGSTETNPNLYFESLSKAEQDRVFTNAGADAIRHGADISQVVNARAGMEKAQVFGRDVLITSAGTTRRGMFGHIEAKRGGKFNATNEGQRGYVQNYMERRAQRPRLMPESIMQLANGDRDEAIRLLKLNGFIF